MPWCPTDAKADVARAGRGRRGRPGRGLQGLRSPTSRQVTASTSSWTRSAATASPTRCARWRPLGRLLVIGFTAGSIPEVKVNRLLLSNIDVVGVGWGAFWMGRARVRPQAVGRPRAAARGGPTRPGHRVGALPRRGRRWPCATSTSAAPPARSSSPPDHLARRVSGAGDLGELRPADLGVLLEPGQVSGVARDGHEQLAVGQRHLRVGEGA